jgi:hypothetical protein
MPLRYPLIRPRQCPHRRRRPVQRPRRAAPALARHLHGERRNSALEATQSFGPGDSPNHCTVTDNLGFAHTTELCCKQWALSPAVNLQSISSRSIRRAKIFVELSPAESGYDRGCSGCVGTIRRERPRMCATCPPFRTSAKVRYVKSRLTGNAAAGNAYNVADMASLLQAVRNAGANNVVTKLRAQPAAVLAICRVKEKLNVFRSGGQAVTRMRNRGQTDNLARYPAWTSLTR